LKCFTRKIRGNWHAAFDFGGVSYTHSLRTRDEREAEVRLGPIRDTLYRLENGTLTMPADAVPKDFILSGGNHPAKVARAPSLTVGAAAELYLGAARTIEANTKKTKVIHLNHVRRILGAGTSLDAIRLADAQRYAKARCSQEYRGKPIQGYTARKELRTFHQVWAWAAAQGHTPDGPPWQVDAVELPKDRGREPFRSFEKIDRILARGHLTGPEQDRLWECLYLSGEELSDLLAHVEAHATAPFVFPMVAFVALTGCRRSEMVRSRIDDWDLEHGVVHIREKKRDTGAEFTIREVDLHPRLAEVMSGWFARHPGGQHAITQDGGPATVDQATDHFKRTLRGGDSPHERWSRVRGFHTLRHSVASILASRGVDQRYIDKIIGHHTEAMRKRYQHLFPKGVKQAIGELLA
jgi:integrase